MIVTKVIRGFQVPFVGFQLIIKSRRNFLYSAIPFFIGFLVFGLGFYFGASPFQAWAKGLLGETSFLESWPLLKQALDVLISVLAWVLFAFLNLLTGYLCLVLVAGPFYALMVENLILSGAPGRQTKAPARIVIRMLFLGVFKVILFTVVGLVCFVLTFIPPFTVIVPFILASLVAFDCTDYAFEIDYLSLSERFRFFSMHFWEYLGLTLAIMTCTLVPGLFFVILPAFVCGATEMYTHLRAEIV